MQKKLEADLISIAHRILQLKNKSDVNQLFLETQKLYEKLAVLRFVEEHFSDAKPTIGQAEVVEKMKEFFETIAVPELQKPNASIKTALEENPVVEIIEEKSIETVISEEAETTTEELPTSIAPEPLEEIKESEAIIAEKEEIEIEEIEEKPIPV